MRGHAESSHAVVVFGAVAHLHCLFGAVDERRDLPNVVGVEIEGDLVAHPVHIVLLLCLEEIRVVPAASTCL